MALPLVSVRDNTDLVSAVIDLLEASLLGSLSMAHPPPPRTPLRRVSHGSLLALSRSGHDPDAPEGLGYLEPALSELADEAEALQVNVEGLKRLSDSLETFNESFASWLYVMNMNALTTDWPQVRHQTPGSHSIVVTMLDVYRHLSTSHLSSKGEEQVCVTSVWPVHPLTTSS